MGGMSKDSPYSRARRPDRILVEAKASGQSLLQDLRLAKVPAVGYNPHTRRQSQSSTSGRTDLGTWHGVDTREQKESGPSG